jgi:hypothetical protein
MNDIAATQGAKNLERFNRLIASCHELIAQHKWSRRNTSARFNVFGALAVEDLELFHSKFIAFLLNPTEKHDQSDRFLKSFLELVGIAAPPNLETAEVHSEAPLPNGRLDILIRIPSKLTVFIENKIWASDQEGQMPNYLRWLNASSISTPVKAIVYLTRTGSIPNEPLHNVDTRQLHLLSYSRLAEWLETLPLPDRLGSVISMYVETCRRVAGRNMSKTYGPELIDLLTQPDNFETALNIVDCVETQRPAITQQFWENVRDRISARLLSSIHSVEWSVVLSEDVMLSLSALAIKPSRAASNEFSPSTNASPSYAVWIECLANNPYDCYYGLARPTRIKLQDRSDLDLETSEELRARGFSDKDAGWCGWRLASDHGLPIGSQNSIEWMTSLNRDNRSPENPLAEQVAEATWHFFLSVRSRAEQLNAFA